MAIKVNEILIRCGKKLNFIDSKFVLYCETFQLLHTLFRTVGILKF